MLLSFKLIRQSVFKLESGNQNILDENTPKTGKWTDTNLKSNLAWGCPITMLSFKLIGQSVFDLESGNQNISDEHKPKMGQQTDTNFETNQALVVSI